MNLIEDILKNDWVQRLFWSFVVIIFSLLIYHVVAKVLNTREKKVTKIMNNKKNKTVIHMLKSIIAGSLSIVTVLMVLQIYGINVSSMLAGVGIASIVIGFALQDSLKDIIRGFVIVSDDYYEIGDVIKYGDNIGLVTSISLLTTKLQDINTMNIVSIANRNIDKVEVASGYIYVPVTLPTEIKLDEADTIMHEITKQAYKLDTVTDAKYQGVSNLSAISRSYQFYVICDPANVLQVQRDCFKVIANILEDHKISIPRDQIEIYNKK